MNVVEVVLRRLEAGSVALSLWEHFVNCLAAYMKNLSISRVQIDRSIS
jgi:hypothetical protein